MLGITRSQADASRILQVRAWHLSGPMNTQVVAQVDPVGHTVVGDGQDVSQSVAIEISPMQSLRAIFGADHSSSKR